jgi:hypothetical protein
MEIERMFRSVFVASFTAPCAASSQLCGVTSDQFDDFNNSCHGSILFPAGIADRWRVACLRVPTLQRE